MRVLSSYVLCDGVERCLHIEAHVGEAINFYTEFAIHIRDGKCPLVNMNKACSG